MAARGSRSAQRARTDAERARLYEARTTWHQGTIRRRKRDNIIAVVAGLLIVIGAVLSQTVLAQVNAPEPERPTPSAPAPGTSDLPTPSPTSDSPAPTPSE